MPNEQKNCCEKCFDYRGDGGAMEICLYPYCTCHTPTEEKIEYTKIAEGTPFEITQIKPTPTVGDDPMRFATGTGLGEIRTDGTTQTECTVCDGSGFVLGTKLCTKCTLTPTEEVCWCGNGFGHCPTHTPTEEKGVFNSDFGEHNLATDLPSPTVSNTIDIDEVIGMIEGMKKDSFDQSDQSKWGKEYKHLDNHQTNAYNSALSSLKQKLEARKTQ